MSSWHRGHPRDRIKTTIDGGDDCDGLPMRSSIKTAFPSMSYRLCVRTASRGSRVLALSDGLPDRIAPPHPQSVVSTVADMNVKLRGLSVLRETFVVGDDDDGPIADVVVENMEAIRCWVIRCTEKAAARCEPTAAAVATDANNMRVDTFIVLDSFWLWATRQLLLWWSLLCFLTVARLVAAPVNESAADVISRANFGRHNGEQGSNQAGNEPDHTM